MLAHLCWLVTHTECVYLCIQMEPMQLGSAELQADLPPDSTPVVTISYSITAATLDAAPNAGSDYHGPVYLLEHAHLAR